MTTFRSSAGPKHRTAAPALNQSLANPLCWARRVVPTAPDLTSALPRGDASIMLIVSALSSLPSHHPDRVRQHVLSTPSFMSFQNHSVIYGEGDPADHLYTVTRVNVRTCKVHAE